MAAVRCHKQQSHLCSSGDLWQRLRIPITYQIRMTDFLLDLVYGSLLALHMSGKL